MTCLLFQFVSDTTSTSNCPFASSAFISTSHKSKLKKLLPVLIVFSFYLSFHVRRLTMRTIRVEVARSARSDGWRLRDLFFCSSLSLRSIDASEGRGPTFFLWSLFLLLCFSYTFAGVARPHFSEARFWWLLRWRRPLFAKHYFTSVLWSINKRRPCDE